jgi:hypothetical protein
LAVPEPAQLEKARLEELTADFQSTKNDDRTVVVQFNPDTLKVTFANQLQQPKEEGKGGSAGQAQFVGKGTTKLALQLWFDVTAPQPDPAETDVRKLTQKVAYFITPQPDAKTKGVLVPPAVRFRWGTFQFDGIVDSLDESLEYFSPEGRPLRASMSLSLLQQTIGPYAFGQAGGPSGLGSGSGVGTKPLVAVTAGATLQGIVAAAGSDDWKAVASANNVTNPRLLTPGIRLDLGGPQ